MLRKVPILGIFLSTLSLRRATCIREDVSYSITTFLSTLSLRRATLFRQNYECFEWIFLSTLSLRRATQSSAKSTPEEANFYPRSPCGERQSSIEEVSKYVIISIHALLAESDIGRPIFFWRAKHFYPRSPCGERLVQNRPRPSAGIFLSTLSLRRATEGGIINCNSNFISIHALLAESDDKNECTNLAPKPFLSTLSLRRATHSRGLNRAEVIFLSTLSLRRATRADYNKSMLLHLFLSTLSLRRATTWARGSRVTYVEFLSTLSLRRATGKLYGRI